MGTKQSKTSEKPASPQPLGDIDLPPLRSGFATISGPRRQYPTLETVRYHHTKTQLPLKPQLPKPPPVAPPQTTQVVSNTAYNIWKNTYLSRNVGRENLDLFDSRLQYNSEQAWMQRDKEHENNLLRVRLQRESVEASLFTNREPPKPRITLPSVLDFATRYAGFKKYDDVHFSKKPERPPLTPEMLAVVKNASIPSPPAEVLVQIDGVGLTRKDFRTLTGLNWLNDEIINAYMFLITQRSREPNRKKVYAFNTFFYPKVKESGYNSVKRWTRKVDIFSYDFLLVPVHLGNHWCLAFINFVNRSIEYYDSLGGGPNGCCDTLLEYLRYESSDKKKQDFDDENWRLINTYSEIGIPQQQNCSDCGVFACIYAEYLTRQAKLSFTQDHMQYFREKMIYELMTKRILE